MHLGNAWSFLSAWLCARRENGKVILRIEDLDPQRSKASHVQAIVDDLRWLGLDWDEGPDIGGPSLPYSQSQCFDHYAAALAKLETLGLTYPCFCTRKDLRSLPSAPQIGDMGVPYPGTCRALSQRERQTRLQAGAKACLRFAGDQHPVYFSDLCCGPQQMTLEDCGGDFALRRSDGVFAYQLAVAVDDARMGVTHVVRGRDILPSTPRQIVLLRHLGEPVPQYAHVPLLLDAEGERLAKRHQSLSLAALREMGVSPARIVGLLGKLAGIHPEGGAITPLELSAQFSFAALPREDVRLDSYWLAKLTEKLA